VAEGIAITKVADNSYIISGKLASEHIMGFIDLLSSQPISSQDPLQIDIGKCKIEDGLTLLAMVKTLLALAKHVPQLIVIGASELLEPELINKAPNISFRGMREHA